VYSDPKRRRPRIVDFMYQDPYTRDEESIRAADVFFTVKGKNNGDAS